MAGNKQKGKNIEGDMIQNSIVIKNTTTTIDELTRLLSDGKFKEINKLLKMQDNIIGGTHSFFPDYVLEMKKIGEDYIPCSKPLTREAFEKYPPKIKGKFKFPDKYKGFKSTKDLLDYSYKTQTEIEINIIELMKMIGDEVDPYQGEIELLLSKTTDWKIKPKEFPEAKPYKVVIEGSEISYDYILLRTTLIKDNKIFLSNKEQKNDTEFNFIFDLENKNISVNIRLDKDINSKKESLLKYLKFIKCAISKNKLLIISLEDNVVLSEGNLDNFDYESPFGNIDDDIMFVEYIILIEEHYNKIIEIPEEIEDDDLKAISYLGKALKYREIKGTWKNVNVNFILTDDLAQNMINLDDKAINLEVVEMAKVLIFKEEFPISKIIKTFENANIKDLDKVKKKIEVLDVGDIIKVTYVPNGDNHYVEQFVFDEDE